MEDEEGVIEITMLDEYIVYRRTLNVLLNLSSTSIVIDLTTHST